MNYWNKYELSRFCFSKNKRTHFLIKIKKRVQFELQDKWLIFVLAPMKNKHSSEWDNVGEEGNWNEIDLQINAPFKHNDWSVHWITLLHLRLCIFGKIYAHVIPSKNHSDICMLVSTIYLNCLSNVMHLLGLACLFVCPVQTSI